MAIEVAPYAKRIPGLAHELPNEGRLSELKDQTLVEMGHGQRRGTCEAVEIGQPGTPVGVHEL